MVVLTCLGFVLGALPARGDTLEDARDLAAQGRPEQALELLEGQLATDPNSAEGLFLQGVLLVELRRAEEASTVFARLIELHPQLPEPYNNLAVIQAADGDYEGAVATLRRSLRTHSSYHTAYENLTKIYTQLASEAYGKALDSEPVERPDVVELVLLGNLELSEEADEMAASATPEAAPKAGAPPAPAQTPEPAPPAEQVVAEMAAEPEEVEEASAGTETPAADTVAPFVDSWRKAWQEQQVDEYLASYSMDFKPSNGLSRERWAQRRRSRLRAPEFIRVTLAYLDEPKVEGTTASIRFLQSYESNTFQDRITKTLVLGWEEEGWKILEERSD
jgi:tetratricopeptide (TPR) repeat protein